MQTGYARTAFMQLHLPVGKQYICCTMSALKNALKQCIPWKLREQRYVMRRARNELRYHFQSAPMKSFSDYDDYWEKRGPLETVHRRWQLAAELVEDGSTLLDVGCGTGEFFQYLRSVRPNVRCKGVDFSDRSLEMLRAAGFDAEKVDIAAAPVAGQYDYVTCFEVIEHIADAESALRHLDGAFRKSLIVSIPNIGYWLCRVRLALLGRFPLTNCQLHVKEHVRHWTPRDFREWVAAHGLKVIRGEGQYGFPYTPWKLWPSLFASGMLYVIQRDNHGHDAL
jgi:methionine biosynthesis protein MetW